MGSSINILFLAALVATGHAVEVVEGETEHVAVLLANCDFGGDRGFLDDPETAAPDFTVKVHTPVTDEDAARELMAAIDGDVALPTFWANFVANGAAGTEVVGEDSFKFSGVDLEGITADVTLSDHVFDAENLCVRFSLKIESEEFPGDMTIVAHGTSVASKEGDEFVVHSSEHGCHAVDAEGADVDDLVHDVCEVAEKRRAIYDAETGGLCLTAFLTSGAEGLQECIGQAWQDAEDNA